jgi:hypothetical protein
MQDIIHLLKIDPNTVTVAGLLEVFLAMLKQDRILSQFEAELLDKPTDV